MKTIYEIIKELVDQHPGTRYNNDCSIMIPRSPIDILGYHQVKPTEIGDLTDDISGSVDIHYGTGEISGVSVIEIFFGDDPKADGYFANCRYFALTPWSILESLEKVTDELFTDKGV